MRRDGFSVLALMAAVAAVAVLAAKLNEDQPSQQEVRQDSRDLDQEIEQTVVGLEAPWRERGERFPDGPEHVGIDWRLVER